MLMESWVKFCKPQNISSQRNSVTTFSKSTEEDGDLFLNIKKKNEKNME